MTKLFNDPAAFSEDLLAGFLDLYADRVVGVDGGVVRADADPGTVAVVVGGGSGHYPAFCGVVGPGFAAGAVVGNIFTSPSTQQAVNVGRAADNGAGVLYITGNYAGDVMNFTLARQRLAEDGIDARTLFVTDDIASAPVDQVERRRGIAGDFVVFKIAGAAAAAGCPMDEVERIARLANDRTRTLGVAFGGCTLPGATAPLFTVPDGQMGVGLGIHGEPGIADAPLPTAAELGRRLVEGVLAELPDEHDGRIGVILNGLGSTKYEELFVVWHTVSRLLTEAGFTVVDPEVGELVTSLDMSGCSLTVVHLDPELERFWRAPADTPAYRKGATAAAGDRQRRDLHPGAAAATGTVAEASEASKACGRTASRALTAMAAAIGEAADELGRIDAVAGDGDHGRGMVKGSEAASAAAAAAVTAGSGVAGVLRVAGEAWAAQAGGTSGVLWGAALTAIGGRLGDGAETIAPADVAQAVDAGLQAIRTLGKAEVGDKTMLDALVPFVTELSARVTAGAALAEAWSAAAATAQQAAEDTAALRPRVGRARPLAERSIGTPDAGAVSLALCARTVGRVLADTDNA